MNWYARVVDRLRKLLSFPLLPSILALVVYAPVLSFQLLWDDGDILENQLPRLSIGSAFAPPGDLPSWSRFYYRPVTVISFVLNRALYGSDPYGYHATVWILHAVAVFAVYRLGKELVGGPASVLGGALFAVFPLHPECVAWIAGRTDVLMTLFCALAAAIYVRQMAPGKERTVAGAPPPSSSPSSRRKRKRPVKPPPVSARSGIDLRAVACCALLFLLALLSKETAVALSLVFLFVVPVWGIRHSKLAATLFLGLLPPLLYMAMRSALNPAGPASPLSRIDLDTLRSGLKALSFFMVHLVAPYPGSPYRLAIPGGIGISIASLLLAAGGILLAWKVPGENRNAWRFLLLWTASGTLVASAAAIFNLSRTAVADRYLYMPAAGWCLLLGSALAGGAEPSPGGAERPGLKPPRSWMSANVLRLASGWALVIVFAGLTIVRTRIYENDFEFWTAAVAADPSAGSARINLGTAQAEHHDIAAAEQEFRSALRLTLAPEDRALALSNLALTLKAEGRTAEAESVLREAEAAKALPAH